MEVLTAGDEDSLAGAKFPKPLRFRKLWTLVTHWRLRPPLIWKNYQKILMENQIS